MGKRLYEILLSWPKNFITTTDLANVTNKPETALYGFIHRGLREGELIPLRRGLFLIPMLFSKKMADHFELSGLLYSPSFVSLQSALSYHGSIPEAVYTTTCMTTKRSKTFINPLGAFSYQKVPEECFLAGVQRIAHEDGIYFMAMFWRAIADLIYVEHKDWTDLEDMQQDMRIEEIPTTSQDTNALEDLSNNYPSVRTRRILKKFLRQLYEYTHHTRAG